MLKLYTSLIILVIGLFQAKAQNNPTIGNASKNQVNIGSGKNFIIINNITDGDGGASQTVTIEATSSNSSILAVDSVSYNSSSTFAVVYVTEKNQQGTTTITVKATDSNGSSSKDFSVSVGQYLPRGVKWSVYDMIFWVQGVPLLDKSVFDSTLTQISIPTSNALYSKLNLTVGPSSGLPKDDFFTNMFKGYLVPPATGNYTFYLNSYDQGALYISNDNKFENATLRTKGDRNTTNKVTVSLEAGKFYAMYAVNWVIHELSYNVEWEGPSVNRSIINSDYLFPVFDLEKPSTPQSLNLKYKGVEFAGINWKRSTDNGTFKGYNVYLNGAKFSSTSDTSIHLTGLTSNTSYSVFVTGVDNIGNESYISNTIRFVTHPNDTQKPLPPTSIFASLISDMSARISWKGASDTGSEVSGYNVYLDGNLYNVNGPIYDTSVVVKVLKPLTSYNIHVEAIDGGNNVSNKSSVFTFKTNQYNPSVSSPGVKKARVSVFTQGIGRHEGFGINADYTGPELYTGEESKLIKDLKPSLIRWGALPANVMNFSEYSGPGKPATYAKFMNYCNQMNAYTAITTGIKDGTDWRKDINTFAHFIEYLNGPATSTYGKLRAAEGYTEPLLKKSRGLLIEIGCEVWGGAYHNAEIGANYTEYAVWSREVAKVIKASPYYDSTKIFIANSGRNPSAADSYGLNTSLITGDKGEVDWITVAGYLGGNLNYDPAIPVGESEVDYYKNGINRMYQNLMGAQLQLREGHQKAKRYIPTYLYESNMTTPNYNGRLGQALIMTDYMISMQKLASPFPTLFHLTGGEWRITEPHENFRKLPLFEMARLINRYTIGNFLRTEVESTEKLYNSDKTTFNMEPVGSHAFYSEGKFSILLTSRDFENEYQVQLNIPDGMTIGSTAKKYVVSGTDFNTKHAIIDSSNFSLSDSMLVTLPKHSMILITFTGPDLKQRALPITYTRAYKINKLTITPANGTNLNTNQQTLSFSVKIEPSNAIFKSVQWKVEKPSQLNLTQNLITGKYTLTGSGTCEGNGTVKLIAMAADDSTFYDEVTVNISNQAPVGTTCTNSIADVEIEENLKVFPVPVKDELRIEAGLGTITNVQLFNVLGEKLVEKEIRNNDATLNLSDYKKGIYFIQAEINGQSVRKKVLKQ